ncbi:MAG: antibiotic biosynthesis monooxygenase [Propionibacteriaceae bacterium]|nr:antibiotic biosynthesis monooxygenase [Propionibacteriaceae bacterium]
MSQIDLIATISVPEDRLSAASALLLAYGEVVRAEPGNHRFEVYVDHQASALVVIERYADADAFDAHLANPANAEFNSNLAEVLGGGGSTLQMLDFLA